MLARRRGKGLHVAAAHSIRQPRHPAERAAARGGNAASCQQLRDGDAVCRGARRARPFSGGSRRRPGRAGGSVAEHFELTIAEPDRQRVVQEFGATSDAASDEDPTRWWRALSAHDRELSEGAVSPFIGGFAGASAPPIVWGAELFSSGDRPDQTAVDPIDITGRGRCLFRGPGIVLPAGPWSLTLELEFSPEAREYEFAVEVTAGPVLAAREVRPRSDVDPAIHLQFAIDEAADAPLEVRFSSRRAAFDGQLFLSHAILVPQPAAPD